MSPYILIQCMIAMWLHKLKSKRVTFSVEWGYTYHIYTCLHCCDRNGTIKDYDNGRFASLAFRNDHSIGLILPKVGGNGRFSYAHNLYMFIPSDGSIYRARKTCKGNESVFESLSLRKINMSRLKDIHIQWTDNGNFIWCPTWLLNYLFV